jgi:hypothetical protein
MAAAPVDEARRSVRLKEAAPHLVQLGQQLRRQASAAHQGPERRRDRNAPHARIDHHYTEERRARELFALITSMLGDPPVSWSGERGAPTTAR